MSDVLEAVRSVVQTPYPQNSQTLMWEMVTPWFWRGYATICALGGFILFANLLRSVERNALTVARLIWLGGFMLGAMVRLNACEPWSAALFATSGAMMSVLVHTGWCSRSGTTGDKLRAILAEAMGWRPKWHQHPQRR